MVSQNLAVSPSGPGFLVGSYYYYYCWYNIIGCYVSIVFFGLNLSDIILVGNIYLENFQFLLDFSVIYNVSSESTSEWFYVIYWNP